jgi:hypothetical protein
LRLAFFKKLGVHQYQRAETIFNIIYAEYEKEFSSINTRAANLPETTGESTFLAELAMLDDSNDGYTQEQERSEHERYLKLGQGGLGKADEPLKWWKVCFDFGLVLLLLMQSTGS